MMSPYSYRGENMVEEEELRNFINSEVIQSIMDNFYSLTQIGVGIIDLKGNVLVATGWQDICTCFHRLHSETAVKCKESDIVLSQGVPPGEIKGYQCKNNLWEFVTPIYIADKHMGNLFLGQFFFEDEVPDYDLFDQQADRYGFDKTEYRAALDRVPRWSRERVNTVLRFYRLLTDMISGLSYSNQKLAIELNKNKQSKEALQKAKDELEQRVADRTTELLHVNEELQTDITERKRAEALLRVSEEKYRELVENANSIILRWSPNGEITFLNEFGLQFFGYTEEEILGRHVVGTIVPEIESTGRDLRPLIDIITADPEAFEHNINENICRNGKRAWISWNNKAVLDSEGHLTEVFSIGSDITERKQAEQALVESEAKYRALIDNHPSGVVIHGPDTSILFANATAAYLLGLTVDQMLGRTAIDPAWRLVGENGVPLPLAEYPVNRVVHSGDNFKNLVVRVRHQDSTQSHWLLCNGYPVLDANGRMQQAVITFTDITDRKQAEEDREELEAQNKQLQKAESLGRMAGAIAHTFNNQLGVVIGNLEMAIDDLPEGAGPVHGLTAAMQAAQKAAAVSGQMLTYLGQSFDKRERMDLAEACRRNLPILEAALPGTVVLEADLSSPGPVVIANAIEIQQVLTNLITNAWEAVGAGRGSIHLSVKTVSPTEIPTVHRHPIDWQPQNNVYACMEVTDTGCGITDNDIEKIFDPFFTSKFTGRGMGLAAVLGIVKAHGGVITVESKPGHGSTFRVFLPVSAEEVPQQPDKDVQPSSIEAGGTVLLVEDEEMVRNMAAAMLNRLGFSVLEAKDGVEAVEVFRQCQDEIRLVLSDLTMPRMDGWETLTALRKLAPDIPVILASGYDKAQVMAGDHSEWPQVFLGKPYRLKELSDAISQALVNKK